jgi:hypothetical protein
MKNTITAKPTHEILPPLNITNQSIITPDKFNNTNLFSQPFCPIDPITSTQLECAEAVLYL